MQGALESLSPGVRALALLPIFGMLSNPPNCTSQIFFSFYEKQAYKIIIQGKSILFKSWGGLYEN